MLRNTRVSSKLRFYRAKSNYGNVYSIATCQLSTKHHKPKNIEDDGYGHFEHSSAWDQLEKSLGKRPDPGALIVVRHGETEWNHRELFTGWVDVDLSDRGIREVEHSARLLLERGYKIDITYTSMLKRAIRSSWIILNEINQTYRPIIKSWRLNERMYGALEGHSKPGLAKIFGKEVIQKWRGGLESPPPMSPQHVYWHGREKKYTNLDPTLIPRGETLYDTIARVKPLWESHIVPDILAGRNVMIVAHRNSIRGLIAHIDGLQMSDVQRMTIPNGIPLVYKFDANLKPIPHKNAAPPISGIWLEKKGLLKNALELEAQIADRIEGYTEITTKWDRELRGYYNKSSLGEVDRRYARPTSSPNATNTSAMSIPKSRISMKTTAPTTRPSARFTINPTSSKIEFHSDLPPATTTLSGITNFPSRVTSTAKPQSWIHFMHDEEDSSSLYPAAGAVADMVTMTLPTSPIANAQQNLIKSLTKLEAEKKLLQLVDANFETNNFEVQSMKEVTHYDDASCADMYVDHDVLSHASLQQNQMSDAFFYSMIHQESMSGIHANHNPEVAKKTEDEKDTKQFFKSPIGLELDLSKLNQIHFFADSDYDVQELEQILGVCFIKDKQTGRIPFLNPLYTGEHIAEKDVDVMLGGSSNPNNTPETSNTSLSSASARDELLQEPLLVIIRHGKTEHNQLGLFTGWEDAALAVQGREEAIQAGKILKAYGISFDIVYTSWLSRAIETAWLVLNELDSLWLPIVKTWRLNERMYGALTGLSKKMIRQIYGDEQFMQWRRGYDTPPPPISSFSHAYPGNDSRYVNYVKDIPYSLFETVIRSLAEGKIQLHRAFPKCESLKDCMERTVPYYTNTIVPDSILTGKNVLIASSENAIRGLLMHLCDIPANKIPFVEIPTGLPLVYDKKHRRIRLFENGEIGRSINPLEKYNFGKAPEYIFKIALPTEDAKAIHHGQGHTPIQHPTTAATASTGSTVDGSKQQEEYWKEIVIPLHHHSS